MKLDRIAIVSIPVADQQKARAFYTEVLGFRVLRDDPMGSGRRWIELCPAGGEPSIALVTWFDAMPPGAVQGLVIDVEDLDGLRGELATRGLDTSPVIEQPYGRFSMFSDPDGNGWVLQETPDRAKG